MIHETIQSKIKEAMLAKDTVRLTTLRGLLSAFVNELVALKRKPQDILTDEEATQVILRSVKQRKDSIEQFTAGGRSDLVENEEAELRVLSEFMPPQMSREEVTHFITQKIAELGITDKSKAGQLMGAVMKDLKGKTTGDVVKEIIDSLL